MDRMKREDNFIRKSFSPRDVVSDKLLLRVKTRNQFFSSRDNSVLNNIHSRKVEINEFYIT